MNQNPDQEFQSQAIVRASSTGSAVMSPEDVKHQFDELQRVIGMLMKPDVHYGVIAGTTKPTLYQPGAQMLCVQFRLRPKFTVEREDLPNDHRSYEAICELYTNEGQFVAMGTATCSTMESRYRYRKTQRACPECGFDGALLKSKKDPGWFCWDKKGGCGAKFADNDARITGQHPGKTENPDPADCWNTVKKMACKRAHVHATIIATGCSDQFTQDLEDGGPGSPEYEGHSSPPQQRYQQPRQQQAPQQQQREQAPPAQDGDPRLATAKQISMIMTKAQAAGVAPEQVRDFCFNMLETVDGDPVQSRSQIQKKDVDTIVKWINGELPSPITEEHPGFGDTGIEDPNGDRV